MISLTYSRRKFLEFLAASPAVAWAQQTSSQQRAVVIEAAHRIGARSMTLTTIPTNIGGIRLYERFGFKTTKTVTSPSYEKHTGIAGRIFMEKELSPAQAATGT